MGLKLDFPPIVSINEGRGLIQYMSSFCLFSASDYIIKEKTVLLQKKDSEGFGFVLRGAKGEEIWNKHTHAVFQLHSVI